jgi:Hemolysins and related proteins containing CBS domains
LEPPSRLFIEFLCLGITLIFLLVCSALISGSETAFFSLSPKQKDKIRNNKDKRSKNITSLLSNPNYLLGAILQINNFVNILIVLISSLLLNKIFDFSGHPILEFIVNTIIVTFILVLFGEVLPKIIATHIPVKFARMMSSPLMLISPVTRPFSKLMNRFASHVTDNIPVKNEITLDDLSKAVDIAAPDSGDEKMMLQGIAKLPVTDVTKIMKPRIDVVAIDMEQTNEEVIKIANSCGFSRLPVYKENLDDIKGFLYIKDMLPYLLPGNQTKFNWKHHIREAYFVPESKK